MTPHGGQGSIRTSVLRRGGDDAVKDIAPWFCRLALGMFMVSGVACSNQPACEPSSVRAIDFLELPSGIRPPSPYGNGPVRAVVVSEALRRAYLTSLGADGPLLTIVNTDAPEDATEVHLEQVGETEVPSWIVVDENHSRLFLNAPEGRWLVFDQDRGTLELLDVTAAIPSVEPDLGTAGELFAYRATTGEMIAIDLSDVGLSWEVVDSIDDPVMPPFFWGGMRAEQAELTFFVAAKRVPSGPHCDFGRCEIWVFAPRARAFRDDLRLEVTTTDVAFAGILGEELARSPVSGEEFLIVVTQHETWVWNTASVAAGNTDAVFVWSHRGATDARLGPVAYVSDPDRVLIGNLRGTLVLYDLTGTNAPDGTPIELSEAMSGMQVRDIAIDGQVAYVALGRFDGAREGLLAIVDLAASPPEVVFQHPVDAVGLGGEVLSHDSRTGTLYSAAVEDTGCLRNGSSFRIPLVRTRELGLTE